MRLLLTGSSLQIAQSWTHPTVYLAEYLALIVAAAVGTLPNTILVLGMAVIRGYMAAGVALPVGVTHGLPEVVVAAIITVAVVVAWKRIEIGRGEAKM